MPACTSGQFYVFVVSDVDNQVDAPACHINNQARSTSPLVVNFGLYPDLIVEGMQFPSTAYGGQSMTVSWSVTNAGLATAVAPWTDSLYLSPAGAFALSNSVFLGAYSQTASLAAGATYVDESTNDAPSTWTDAVYLSTNSVWDVTALLVASHDHSGLAALGSYTDTWTGALPALTPGPYHAIVRTDVRNTARETNLSNNLAVSASTILVDVPVLVLGQSVTNALSTGTEQYYKVNVPAGQRVQISLNSASSTSANELYVRYGAVPDLGHYDFLFNDPLGANQEIQIPVTQAGWYYILARGGNVPDAPASYTLSAQVIPFAIITVSPAHFGDNGQVTLTLNGAKFQPGASVQLLGTNASYAAVTNFF